MTPSWLTGGKDGSRALENSLSLHISTTELLSDCGEQSANPGGINTPSVERCAFIQ